MKKLALLALSVVASAAMAQTALGPNAIVINGSSEQLTSISGWSAVRNTASGVDSEALQNLASNAGNITITGSGDSDQTVIIKNGSWVTNTAEDHAIAQQNLASNVGKVTISGDSEQKVTVDNGTVDNHAYAHTIAQQSLSSNVGNVTIGGDSTQTTNVLNSGVYNVAWGYSAKAVQNISSNNSCSTFTCANAN